MVKKHTITLVWNRNIPVQGAVRVYAHSGQGVIVLFEFVLNKGVISSKSVPYHIQIFLFTE